MSENKAREIARYHLSPYVERGDDIAYYNGTHHGIHTRAFSFQVDNYALSITLYEPPQFTEGQDSVATTYTFRLRELWHEIQQEASGVKQLSMF